MELFAVRIDFDRRIRSETGYRPVAAVPAGRNPWSAFRPTSRPRPSSRPRRHSLSTARPRRQNLPVPSFSFFYLVLPSFIESFQVFAILTKFYLVLPSFAKFSLLNLVLPGLT